MRRSPTAALALAVALGVGMSAAATGCGGSARRAVTAAQGPAPAVGASGPVGLRSPASVSRGCENVAMGVLGNVAERVYGEGLKSDTVHTARVMVARDAALRSAAARADAVAARAQIKALIATGHMLRMRILVGRRVLVDEGSPLALGGSSGSLGVDAAGQPIGYRLAVQEVPGLASAAGGLTAAELVIRSGRRVLTSRLGRPVPRLPLAGEVRLAQGRSLVFSFPVRLFDGRAGRLWLVRTRSSTRSLCGLTAAETRARAAGFVGLRIYNQELHGHSAQGQVQRVSSYSALVSAVQRGDSAAARAAIVSVLNQHVVRLRVLRGTQLLADVGGPYVLAPVAGALRAGGATVGRFVLSVQDDMGYLLLAHRLIGVEVVIRDGAREVMGTMRPGPASIPDLGPVSWRGRRYEAFSFDAARFPSGTLRISLLEPL